jgi:glycosyltransferase involved in cell wall biosynthesis
LSVSETRQEEILGKHGLQSQSYFYYPAQFWAHKNHFNLVEAFKLFRESSHWNGQKLAFSGADHGNKDYILSVIKHNHLEKDVLYLGFVSNDEVYTLYRNSIALVMPTFLGPTNMPLLEARALGTAVIASDLKGHRELCEDGALYCNPLNPQEWANAMAELTRPEFRSNVLSRASKLEETSVFNIRNAVKKLEEALLDIKPLRDTFG